MTAFILDCRVLSGSFGARDSTSILKGFFVGLKTYQEIGKELSLLKPSLQLMCKVTFTQIRDLHYVLVCHVHGNRNHTDRLLLLSISACYRPMEGDTIYSRSKDCGPYLQAGTGGCRHKILHHTILCLQL